MGCFPQAPKGAKIKEKKYFVFPKPAAKGHFPGEPFCGCPKPNLHQLGETVEETQGKLLYYFGVSRYLGAWPEQGMAAVESRYLISLEKMKGRIKEEFPTSC